VAAGGRSLRTWHAVESRLRPLGFETDVFFTRGRGDGTEQAREALRAQHTTILAVGGDGTLHEVVNALLDHGIVRSDVRIGIVPAGTGMDFARNARLRRGVRAAVDRIVRGEERRFDLGALTEPIPRLFVNFAEAGLGSSVVAREAAFSSRWPGRASFFLAGIAAAARDHPITGTLMVDGSTVYDGRLVSLVIANGAYFGGGMKIAPPARMDDGELDVVLLGDLSRVELVSQIWKLYPGTHLRNPQVHWMRGSEVTFAPGSPGHIDLDGELYVGGQSRMVIHRRTLRVLVEPGPSQVS
jgi:diacylglycerol kinase (ATP)